MIIFFVEFINQLIIRLIVPALVPTMYVFCEEIRKNIFLIPTLIWSYATLYFIIYMGIISVHIHLNQSDWFSSNNVFDQQQDYGSGSQNAHAHLTVRLNSL